MPAETRRNKDERPLPEGSYKREGEGLEFDRLSFFSDAVFAIAMTLLVVELGIPELNQDAALPGTMFAALAERAPEILSFFIGFAVLSLYWTAHHHFFARLRAVSRTFIRLNLFYLALVAFLPFPTAILGEHAENPVSVALFALNVAMISGLEVILFVVATGQNLTKRSLPPAIRRFGIIASATPLLVFVVSIPIAFWNPTAALYSWLLSIPVGVIVDRYAPTGAGEYL